MKKETEFKRKIEEQRKKLEKAAQKKDIEDKDIQKISKKLDELLNKYYKHTNNM